MTGELAQGRIPSRKPAALKEGRGLDAAKAPHPTRIPSQDPPAGLFLPENRQGFLQHLVEIQLPRIRDLVGRLLENGFFLLEPAEVCFQVIERAVVEADEYVEGSSFSEWIRGHAAAVIHETVMGEDEDSEGRDGNEPLRRHFNRLPLEERRALYLVAVLGHSIEDAARRTAEEPSEVQQHARAGLRKILSCLDAPGRNGENHGR